MHEDTMDFPRIKYVNPGCIMYMVCSLQTTPYKISANQFSSCGVEATNISTHSHTNFRLYNISVPRNKNRVKSRVTTRLRSHKTDLHPAKHRFVLLIYCLSYLLGCRKYPSLVSSWRCCARAVLWYGWARLFLPIFQRNIHINI